MTPPYGNTICPHQYNILIHNTNPHTVSKTQSAHTLNAVMTCLALSSICLVNEDGLLEILSLSTRCYRLHHLQPPACPVPACSLSCHHTATPAHAREKTQLSAETQSNFFITPSVTLLPHLGVVEGGACDYTDLLHAAPELLFMGDENILLLPVSVVHPPDLLNLQHNNFPKGHT